MPTPAGWSRKSQHWFTARSLLTCVTHSTCCKHVAWHESLSFRHSLQQTGNAKDQVLRGGVLAQLSIDMSLHAKNFV